MYVKKFQASENFTIPEHNKNGSWTESSSSARKRDYNKKMDICTPGHLYD